MVFYNIKLICKANYLFSWNDITRAKLNSLISTTIHQLAARYLKATCISVTKLEYYPIQDTFAL